MHGDEVRAGEKVMSGSVNKVIVVGNLGRDPEVRRLSSGDPVVTLRVATTESWKDKATGERRDKTEWHSVVIFNEQLARVAENYLKKGAKVYIEGQLQTRKWTDQNNQERYTTEIVLQRYRGELTMLDSRGGGSRDDSYGDDSSQQFSGGRNQDSFSGGRNQGASSSGGSNAMIDDDIPF